MRWRRVIDAVPDQVKHSLSPEKVPEIFFGKQTFLLDEPALHARVFAADAPALKTEATIEAAKTIIAIFFTVDVT